MPVRKYNRRPRKYKRRMPMKRAVRPRNDFLSVKRKTWLPQINSTSNVSTFGSYAFSLSTVSAYSEFVNLFDQYRICAVRLQFFPRVSEVTGQGLANQVPFHYAVDYTDVTPPSSVGDVLQYNNSKTRQALKPFTIYLKPRVAQTIWQGVSAAGYAPGRPSMWLDSKSYGVQHYGLKWVFDAQISGFSIDVMATYYCQFKGAN